MQVTNYKGEAVEVDCLSCSIIAKGKDNPGAIYRSQYFDVHQDFEVPIPGMVILSSVRHLRSVDGFTSEEQKDFISLLVKAREGLRKKLHIETIYLVQEEDTNAHFHIWLFPRNTWMEEFGTKIQSVEPIITYAKTKMKTPENLAIVEDAIKLLKDYFV